MRTARRRETFGLRCQSSTEKQHCTVRKPALKLRRYRLRDDGVYGRCQGCLGPWWCSQSYNKIVGGARWLRTFKVSVRNGREADFEERAKEAKAALEKGSKWVYFVSQVIAGSPGNTYYVTTLQPLSRPSIPRPNYLS
jgi:hypothetical protein